MLIVRTIIKYDDPWPSHGNFLSTFKLHSANVTKIVSRRGFDCFVALFPVKYTDIPT